nr:uncharacterized protein K02A2.6-like [Parasteatoda tepidariorum]
MSKWIEVRHMTSTSASATVDVLREIFATHGIPEVTVSDNGGQFRALEYQTFLERNLVRRVMIAPRRPSGNGQAERTVQTVKTAVRRIVKGNWRKRLAKFLLQQHCTPTTTISASLAKLLMGRKLRHRISVSSIGVPDFLREESRQRGYDCTKASVRKWSG